MSIVIKYRAGIMPISTQLYQQAKAAEQFYYMMLFANDPMRAGNSDTWTTWAAMGLHIQVKMPPHSATRAERMLLEINPHGNELYVYNFTGGDRKNSERLKTLLTDVDRLRAELKDKDEAARLKAVRADPAVARQLLEPLEAALKKSGCSPQVCGQFEFAINRGLIALTWPQIQSVEITIQ
ncbi:MAG TPA: hypothetical protein VN754_06085 [Candidatus Binataceae bacterium]|nr:hypothetical protein [Candidatus Binataceae bacterium]